MKSNIFISFLFLATIIASISSCDKNQEYNIVAPPSQAHFVGSPSQKYAVAETQPPAHKITIGVTDVSAEDREVSVNVSSPTGAVAGTHYTIVNPDAKVTIPAGQVTGTLEIQGNLAAYPLGRVDTLVITISEPGLPAAAFSSTVRLAVGDVCIEGKRFDITTFNGNWGAIETFGTEAPYGPYPVQISGATATSATTGTIVVSNIWNSGWGPLTFNLDWTNPDALIATVVTQNAIPGSNAGQLNSAYAGRTISVRAMSGNAGTFSNCDVTLTLKMQLGVTAVGWFSSLYTVNLSR